MKRFRIQACDSELVEWDGPAFYIQAGASSAGVERGVHSYDKASSIGVRLLETIRFLV